MDKTDPDCDEGRSADRRFRIEVTSGFFDNVEAPALFKFVVDLENVMFPESK